MPKYKIGDQVWAAHFNPNQTVHVPCGVCYGKRVVTLILGNGESVKLPCDYCSRGYDAPTGYEIAYQAVSTPELIRIDGVEIKITAKGEEVEYHAGTSGYHRIFKEDVLFIDKEEARLLGEQLAQEYVAAKRKSADWLKADKKKNFSWNAGYHLRAITGLEKEILYHKEKAQLCKERSKDVNALSSTNP